MLPTESLKGSERYLQVDSHIGQGTYGKVEKAQDKLTGNYVAIKKVRVEVNAKLDQNLDEAGLAMLNGISHTVYREIKIMRELDHPNVITLNDVYVEGDFINLVMPLMESDLQKLLEKRVRLNESQIKCIMKQILEGVAELHRNFFLHRDLSPGNIFINNEGICKVADFGLSRSFGSPRPSKKTHMVVTLWYRAPELLYGANYYQDKVDVWSIGCILGQLLSGGRVLFPGQNEVDQLAKIFAVCGSPTVIESTAAATTPAAPAAAPPSSPAPVAENAIWPEAANLPLFFEFTHATKQQWSDIFPLVPAIALNLLNGLLHLDPLKRMTCEQALKHEWFSSAPRACVPEALPRV